MNKLAVYNFVPLARTIAQESPIFQFKHVSFITDRNGVLLSIGFNQPKTHPLLKRFGYRGDQIHSEMAAYLGVRWYEYKRMNLINFRFNNQLELRFSRPCKYCLSWVPDIFEEIWYSTDNDTFKKEKF